MIGVTAYFGLLGAGRPEEGETVVVAGAAGATGSIVGQIGRIKGRRVIGAAGGAEKCRRLTEDLGFDAAIGQRSERCQEPLEGSLPEGRRRLRATPAARILDALRSGALAAAPAIPVLLGARPRRPRRRHPPCRLRRGMTGRRSRRSSISSARRPSRRAQVRAARGAHRHVRPGRHAVGRASDVHAGRCIASIACRRW